MLASRKPFVQEVQMVVPGLGSLLLFLVLIGCVGFCQLCCLQGKEDTTWSRANDGRAALYTFESDAEEAHAQPMVKRKLGLY